MKATKKNSIKREESHACMSYPERENVRRIGKMARTAKKGAKRVSIAAATVLCMGASYADDVAAQQALADMADEYPKIYRMAPASDWNNGPFVA